MKPTLLILSLLTLGLFTTASVFAAASTPDKTTDKTADKAVVDCAKDSHYPLISKVDLKKHVDAKDAFVVDVNSTESFKDAHVPEAIHFADHKADFAKLLPAKKDSLVVAYCGGPQCEAWLSAAQKACELGYTNVQHFKEGITGWKKI